MNCPNCGRFVKERWTEHYYNGTFDCIRTYAICAKCGHVTVEVGA